MKSDEVDTSGNRTGNGDEVERTDDNDGGGGDNGEEATSAGAIDSAGTPSEGASGEDDEAYTKKTQAKGALEQLHDGVGPAPGFSGSPDPAPAAFAAEQVNDDAGPPPDFSGSPNPTPAALDEAYFKKTQAKGASEQLHDNTGPAPDFSGSPDPLPADLQPPMPMNLGRGSDGDGVENQDGDEEGRYNAVSIPTTDDIEMNTNAMGIDAAVSGSGPTQELRTLEPDSSVPLIPTAFLVEPNDEENVIISGYAEPMPPLYRQKRVQQLILLVFLVIVAAVIAVVVVVNRPSPPGAIVAAVEDTPVPTSSPTSCTFRISETMDTLDDLPVEEPGFSVIAADSSNLILATRDVKSTESIYLIFYQWNDGLWQFKNFIIEQVEGVGLIFSADIFGENALVGFPGAGSDSRGIVYAYSQNDRGFWSKDVASLLPTDGSRVGSSVNLDGDLACVSAEEDGKSSVHLFLLDDDGWRYFDKIDPRGSIDKCLIAGDVITVKVHDEGLKLFRYDRTLSQAVPLQDIKVENKVKRIGATSLDGKHLLYSLEHFNFTNGWLSEEVVAYQRQGSGPYTISQRMNASNFDNEFGHSLDHSGDFLVIAGLNKTYTFAEEDGSWEQQESVLEQGYQSYQVTGRSITAMTPNTEFGVEFVSFHVEGCFQPVPTGTPSVSLAPSPLLSPAPSTVTPKPSTSPTLSIAPTETCAWVNITFVSDPYQDEISWDIQKILENGESEVVISRQSIDVAATGAEEHFCLPEGMYNLTVKDSGGDGICCEYGQGIYQLSSDGVILVEGGDFESSESTPFSISVSNSAAT